MSKKRGELHPSADLYSQKAFQQGLRELGYQEGKNILIEFRYADERMWRLPELAQELVRLNTDVLVVSGGTNATIRVSKVANNLPIVFTTVSDPVGSGLVASLVSPRGNVTGLSSFLPNLVGKRLKLLKETIPKLSGVAVLVDATDPGDITSFKEIEAVARAVGIQLQAIELRQSNDFGSAGIIARTGGLLVLPTSLFNSQRKEIAQFAINNRIPTMFSASQLMDTGGLMSYGPDYADLTRRAATYVHKILKGAKAGDLPIEQPTKFELVINLKTAKQIGLTIPDSVLYRAHKVIR